MNLLLRALTAFMWFLIGVLAAELVELILTSLGWTL